MKNSKIFDDVIMYLEKIVHNGCDIDYREISKIVMCPVTLFQRIFIFISGISISDYVRKRRLTIAGEELRNSNISILDIAIKYGFQNHSAFTRAFKNQHGITPSQARVLTAKLIDYPPINYSDMRFIGGKRIMAEMKKIIYKQADERLMVGMFCVTSFEKGSETWQAFFEGDFIEKLNQLSTVKCCDDLEENDGIGFMHDFDDKNNFSTIIGDFVKVDAEIPEGLYVKYIPKGLVAYVQIEGNNIGDILDSAYLLITEAIEKTGKEIDYKNFYWGEVYTHERYVEPLRRGEKVTIDYIIPIK